MDCIVIVIIIIVIYVLCNNKQENKSSKVDYSNNTTLDNPIKPYLNNNLPKSFEPPIVLGQESLPISTPSPSTTIQPARSTENINIEVLPEYEKVLSNLLSSEQTITFVTGGAGTGKSYLIKWLKTKLPKDNTALLAPTGIAAINIGGLTIHSFCWFKPTVVNFENDYKTDSSYSRNSRLKAISKQIKYLIIDEISMVRCDLLDGINDFFCYFRNNYSPFGGINVLFVGDLYQLPPVVTDGEANILKNMGYQIPCYCFFSKIWQHNKITFIDLVKQQRQKSKEFYDILTQVRFGNNSLQILDYFNKKCSLNNITKFPYLTLTRIAADNINQSELNKIQSKKIQFIGEFWGKYKKPDDQENLPAPENLILKVGARVMTLKNASDRSYVNGSIGEIIEIFHNSQKTLDSKIKVRLLESGKIVYIEKAVWEKYQYVKNKDWNSETKYKLEVVGTYTQIPLILAYAVTIHKAQGLTLPSMTLYKGQNVAFAAGQTYVALSRCPSVENISLDTELTSQDIFTDEAITKEYSRMKLQSFLN